MTAASDATNPLSLRGRDRLLLLGVSLALLLPGVFGVSLTDRDEGWYAQVSREMLASGDWLTPTYLGEPWLAKPPLLYWCVASSYAVFGESAAAGRLVSVLATAGAVQLLAALAAKLVGRRAALIAGVCFVTAALPVVIGKMLLTDGLLLVCCLGAMLTLWRIATRRASLLRGGAFWLCIGLGLLAKGPAILLFVGGFAVALATLRRGRRWAFSAKLWLASLVCVAVAAPWYVYIGLHQGDMLWHQFLWYETLSRLFNPPHEHGGPPGYHLLVGLAGWLPWTVLLPGAVLEVWRARRRDGAARMLLLWWLLPWVLLELMPGKLPHYALPCYVPLAIMLGRLWDLALGRRLRRHEPAVLAVWAGVPIVLGLVLLGVVAGWHQATWAPAAGVSAAALIIGFAIVAWFVKRRRLSSAWVGAVCAMGVFHALVGLWVLPELEPYRLSRVVARRAAALATPDAPVLVSGYTEPTLFFYLNRPAIVVSGEELGGRVAAVAKPCVLVVRAAELAAAQLTPPAPDPAWSRIEGFNYVKGHAETIWVARLEEELGTQP